MSSAEPGCPVNGLAMMSYHRSMVSDIVPPGSNLEKYLGPSVISKREGGQKVWRWCGGPPASS